MQRALWETRVSPGPLFVFDAQPLAQPPTGMLLHRSVSVYSAVDLTLKGAFSDDEYHTISDDSGTFLSAKCLTASTCLRLLTE